MPRTKTSPQRVNNNSIRKIVSRPKNRVAARERNTIEQHAVLRLEQEPPLHHRVAALINANYPGERRASSAYDDRVCKRRKTSSIGMPWDDEPDNGMEKPPFTSQSVLAPDGINQAALGTAAWVETMATDLGGQDPIEAMGDFAKLPTEIRDNILRHLLVHHCDIRVLRGWSLLFPRSRPNLQTGILSACRVLYREGIRILYGENTFLYLIRDLSEARQDTDVIVQHVYQGWQLPIDKHGHLIRNIRIVVEANRMRLLHSRQNLPGAIQKFLPGRGLAVPAQLRTVTLELPAQTRAALKMRREPGARRDDVPAAEWFRADSPVLAALTSLNCQFIRVVASGGGGNKYEATVDRRPHFTELGAGGGAPDIWCRDGLMLDHRRRSAARSRGRLASLHYWLGRLARERPPSHNGEALLRDGPFRCYVPEAEHVEPLEQLPSGSSSRASATLARHRLAMSSASPSQIDSDVSDEDLEEIDEIDENENDDSLFVDGEDT